MQKVRRSARPRRGSLWLPLLAAIPFGLGIIGTAPDVRADASEITGISAEPDCSSGQRVKIINPLGMLDS